MRLELENASCSGQPITSFFQESFPRITSLVLHTGPGPRAPAPSQFPGTRPVVMNNARQHMNAPTRSLNTGGCSPNEGFWTGIFNGTSFPHLEEVEIHHVPMDIQGWGAPKLAPSDLRGLRNITRLAVSEAPELNGDVMMSALQCAPNLKHLELKNINGLDYEGNPHPPISYFS